MKIWVTGHSGLLGQEVTRVLEGAGRPFVGTGSEHDISDLTALRRFVTTERFDWIINCAAFTDVDGAEREPDRAFAVNAQGPRNLAVVAAEQRARLIHISTDYVFSGDKGDYREDEATGPLSEYGRSKLQGERHVMAQSAATGPAACLIVRTAWLYGRGGGNFIDTMLRLFRERDEVAVVDDQYGNPTYVRDVAAALNHIIASDARGGGTYHVTHRGRASRYDLACAIYAGARQRGLIKHDVAVRPIPSSQYPTVAPRPADTTLNGARFTEVFGMQLSSWQEALNDYLDLLVQDA